MTDREVAARFGTSRQSVDTWRRRFRDEGCPGWRTGRAART
ncbi:MAG: helix-turn-helix domain-containing protein [Pseudonocardia sp.]